MNYNHEPSIAGIRPTGLEIKKRSQPVQPVAKEESKVTTKRPSAPTPSNRGYA